MADQLLMLSRDGFISPLGEVSVTEWVLVHECESRISLWAAKLPLGDMTAYAKRRGLPLEVIDGLQDMENKAAWLCLYGPDAVQNYVDALKTTPLPM